jgi:transcriptional regulator with XRE-family HTH domain
MLDISTIGHEISERRRSLKLSQIELARRAHVSRPTLNALENQRIGELGFSRITRILAVLGMELRLQKADSRRPTLDELREEDRDDRRNT